MSVFKGKERWARMAAVLLSVTIMVGCAPTFKYSYDTKARFPDLKSYTWAPSSSLDRLLEKNVQDFADQLLAQKGFKKMPEKADLVIKMGYDHYYGYQNSYELQGLNLFIYKTENRSWSGGGRHSVPSTPMRLRAT